MDLLLVEPEECLIDFFQVLATLLFKLHNCFLTCIFCMLCYGVLRNHAPKIEQLLA